MTCCSNPACREEKEEMIERIRQLLDRLQGCAAHDLAVRLGLSACQATLLSSLMQRKVCSKDSLLCLLESRNGDVLTESNIKVHIHRLRKALEPMGVTIETLRGVGYTLSARGRLRLAEIVS